MNPNNKAKRARAKMRERSCEHRGHKWKRVGIASISTPGRSGVWCSDTYECVVCGKLRQKDVKL